MRSRKHEQTSPSPVPLAPLLIDVLTTFQFPDGDAILQGALSLGDALVRLKTRARRVGKPLLPDGEDYFVLKPMHSAFYMTPLDVLLQHLQVETLILTGLTSNSCITVTAHDANMCGFDIYTPLDCSCARNEKEHAGAWAVGGDGWCEPQTFDLAKAAQFHSCSADRAAVWCSALV